MRARPRSLRIFLSHTSDLRESPSNGSFVAAAEDAVNRAGHAVMDMAYFSASGIPPAALCQETLSQADVYVGIVGQRYGSTVPRHPELSYTELEFDTATTLGLPRLVLLVDLDALPEPDARQALFRRKLQAAAVTTVTVRSPEALETRLYQSLVELPTAEDRTQTARI